jgi:hypothetical protein
VVLTLGAVALLQFFMYEAQLHDLNPFITNDFFILLPLGYGISCRILSTYQPRSQA